MLKIRKRPEMRKATMELYWQVRKTPADVLKVLRREGWIRAALNDVLKRTSMSVYRENQLRELLQLDQLPEDYTEYFWETPRKRKRRILKAKSEYRSNQPHS